MSYSNNFFMSIKGNSGFNTSQVYTNLLNEAFSYNKSDQKISNSFLNRMVKKLSVNKNRKNIFPLRGV